MPPLPLRKRLLFSLILLSGVWLLAELVCQGGLWVLERKGIVYRAGKVKTLSEQHRRMIEHQLLSGRSSMAIDPLLGWIPRPGSRTRISRINRAGLRADCEYPPEPRAGALRLAAFGDSFTFGDEVDFEGTWERQLERMEPRLEVLNFGIPGGDAGMAFLRYERDGGRFHPDVVLIGFLSENIHRMVNTFRPFYLPDTSLPLGKPRFLLRGGRLELAENPLRSPEDYRELLRNAEEILPRLGRNDFFYQASHPRRFDVLPSVRLFAIFTESHLGRPTLRKGIYNTRSEAYQVTRAVLEAFCARVEKDGAVPVVLLFPTRDDLFTHYNGLPIAYAPLRADLERRGIRVLDLAESFQRQDPHGRLLEQSFAHYTPAGNRIVARALRELLFAQRLLGRESVGRAVRPRKISREPRSILDPAPASCDHGKVTRVVRRRTRR